ncbi:ribonuclease H-like domain-containing protein [Tanacetum coccineum]
MTETMEQYMCKTYGNYGSGVARPKIDDKTYFESNGQFLKELRENTFSGSELEDPNEHIEKVLEIVHLFHIPEVTQDQIMLRAFPMSLTGAASRWLWNEPSRSITNWETLKTKFLNKLDVPTRQIPDLKGAIPTKTAADAKVAIQEMAEYSQKWHNRTSSKTKPEFGTPYQPRGQYRAAGTGFYQCSNKISLYHDRRQTLEESLTKFMVESAKRHEENSNIIKEIRASTDATIRNQRASIKTLEIQIGQMSKVLQERGFGSLPGSTETNPKDHVKLISTAKADSSVIRRIGSGLYAVSDSQYSNIFSKMVPFPRRLHGYYCDWKEACEVKILETYDNTLPQKDKDPGSFTLPCFIHNVCFDKALVNLGASVSVMPFFTYTNLGLGDLAHIRLTIELADITIKHLRGIAENMLVRIGKFIFPINFIILDIPEDDDVPLILKRPFLSTAYAKIDVFKRKITLRVGYKHVIADFLPTLSINMMTKRFYNSIIKDKGDHEGKNLAGTLIDKPIFVGKFSIISGFLIIDDMDITSGVVLGMPFCKKFVSCQKIMEKFAHEDECERKDDDE